MIFAEGRNIEYMKSKPVFIFMLFFVFLGCTLTKKPHNGIIAYQICDSLNEYLTKEIVEKTKNDAVQAIIIDSKCLNTDGIESSNINRDNELWFTNLMKISVLYKSEGYCNPLIGKSNRYMSIGNIYYPVYLLFADDVLNCAPELVNKVYDSGYIPQETIFSRSKYIIADIARSEFYINGNYENAIGRQKHLNILWRESRKLQFDDFRKGTVDCSSTRTFISHHFIYLDSNKSEWSNDRSFFRYDIKTFFFADSSWIIDNNTILLHHDQGHFDLKEVCARKMRSFTSTQKIDLEYNRFNNSIDSIENNLALIDSLYDQNTNRGLNIQVQKIWDLKIQKMLDTLNEYRNTNGTVRMSPN